MRAVLEERLQALDRVARQRQEDLLASLLEPSIPLTSTQGGAGSGASAKGNAGSKAAARVRADNSNNAFTACCSMYSA